MTVAPQINIRSVKDIRTHSGSIEQAAIPYKAYMRISCLEMEKARRIKEKNQTMERVHLIDLRIAEIEAEKELLKNALAKIEGVAPSSESRPLIVKSNSRNIDKAGAQSASCVKEGFKISY